MLCGLSLLVLVACKSHYTVGDIGLQRLVIDSRYDTNPDVQAAAFLAPYKQAVDSVMGPVLGEVTHDMAARAPESDLSNLLADILVAMSDDYDEKPDFGIYNIGGIRASFIKGKVTYGDVLAVAPFDNRICFITMTGETVLTLFRQIAAQGGQGVSHGVELVISTDGKLLSARLHGKEIDPKGSYRVSTIDYLAQGNDHLTAFKEGTDLKAPQDEKNNSRYVIAEYFRRLTAQGRKIDAKVEGRIIVKSE